MKTKLVVFDLAGTTVADRGNVNQAFREAFAADGIAVDEAQVNKLMGYRKIEAIANIISLHFPGETDRYVEVINRIHDRFIHIMVDFYSGDPALHPLPFAEEMFGWLQERGCRVALNTGFTRTITNAILTKLNWRNNPLINTVVCSDEVKEGRPHPYMITTIMQQLQIPDAAAIVKVGDTEVDILEGRNAGCGKVVSVTTGACNRSQLSIHKPDAIIDSLQELPALIY